MLALVLKDLYQQRKTLLSSAAFGGAFIILFSRLPAGSSAAYTWIIMLTFGYVTRAAYDEDRNKSLLFLRAMPLPPEEIVIAKYISTLIVALGAYGFSVGGYLAMVAIGLAQPERFLVIQGFSFLSVSLLLMGSFLAVFFGWNYGRAITSLRLLVLPGLLIFLYPKAATRIVIDPQAETAMPLKFLGIGLLGYLLLIVFSVWAFKRREITARG